MSQPDLPQPIYPGQGPGPTGPAAGGSPPTGAGAPPTWSVGPPGGGYDGGPPSKKPNPQIIIAGVAVVVVIVAAVAFAMTRDDGKKNAGPTPSTTAPRRTPGSAPGSTPGSKPGSTPGSTPEIPTGGDDLAGRADQVASVQFVTAVSGDVTGCISENLQADPDLLSLIEPMAGGVQFDSADDANRYANLIMNCASPLDMTNEIVQSLASQYDQTSLVCIEASLSPLTSDEWVQFIEAGVQPSRAAEVQDLVAQAAYC